ncbi:YraN family protein [Pararhodospirillum photometricum]|uniref:UPF0102 protein RSPPHO_03049 n=1 Tax=Pararhodospirillum photometricum DSM 122 TaxID=1150469 RepID=H6SQF6_PARPM|nr:YraN family protein [Pararhodospirillum photometricum]CCG09675.1 UPF0102 protein amb4503 [Pararhodospirillum photometricum DSM 122]
MTLQRRRHARARGRWAETWACLWLRLKGWRIVARGWHRGRGTGVGEVDIIARRGAVLAFVEVKARARLDEALEAVSARQRRRLERAALVYLGRFPGPPEQQVRFDVVAVGHWGRIHHVEEAWWP